METYAPCAGYLSFLLWRSPHCSLFASRALTREFGSGTRGSAIAVQDVPDGARTPFTVECCLKCYLHYSLRRGTLYWTGERYLRAIVALHKFCCLRLFHPGNFFHGAGRTSRFCQTRSVIR